MYSNNNDHIDLGVVNFHFTYNCNFRCKFCHSHFHSSAEKELLPISEWKIISQLLKPYCRRINFAGGEPLLHKDYIDELLRYNHELGIISTIITNGCYITEKWLSENGPYLKAIGISCDSSNEKSQLQLGRGSGRHVKNTRDAFQLIQQYNRSNDPILLKLNTVVNKLNFQENMVDFVADIGVSRWKVFQLLTIEGENTKYSDDLIISKKEFNRFVEINKNVEKFGVEFVAENIDVLTDSYIMVNPEGCFFSNEGQRYLSSEPIHKVGVEKALTQINFNPQNIENLNRMFI